MYVFEEELPSKKIYQLLFQHDAEMRALKEDLGGETEALSQWVTIQPITTTTFYPHG